MFHAPPVSPSSPIFLSSSPFSVSPSSPSSPTHPPLMPQVFTETLEAMDHIEDLCTYLFTALERIAAPVEWSNVDVFQQAEALLVRGEVGRVHERGGGSLSSWLCECLRIAASLQNIL